MRNCFFVSANTGLQAPVTTGGHQFKKLGFIKFSQRYFGELGNSIGLSGPGAQSPNEIRCASYGRFLVLRHFVRFDRSLPFQPSIIFARNDYFISIFAPIARRIDETERSYRGLRTCPGCALWGNRAAATNPFRAIHLACAPEVGPPTTISLWPALCAAVHACPGLTSRHCFAEATQVRYSPISVLDSLPDAGRIPAVS
jgi:hypothetical protein